MRKVLAAAALGTLAIAVALPVEASATLLAGAASPSLGTVESGVRIFKAVLAFHGLLFFALAFVRLPPPGAEPLLDRGLAADRSVHPLDNWIVAFLLAVAGALRVFDLGDGLWFDEIDTLVHYARMPVGHIVTTFDSQNQHLLYSVLARWTFALYGESASALRLPAAILGVASVWAQWHFARLVTDRREALFATALLTVSYHHVWFSQNARGYTGLLFFTLIGSTLFLRMLAARETRSLLVPVAYGACMALAVAIHVTALFVVAAHGLVWLGLLLARRQAPVGAARWMPGLGFLLTASLALLAYALVLPQFPATMMAKSMPGASTEWKDPLWMARETLAGLARGLPGGWLALVQVAAIGGLGLWSYARQSRWVLAVMLLGPALTLASIVLLHHNLWPRLFFFSAGFLVLIAFRGVFAFFRLLSIGPVATIGPKLAWIAAVLLVLASAATLPRAYGPKQDFRGALELVRASVEPEDAVVTVEMTDLPYREYFVTGWSHAGDLDGLVAIERAHRRTWVVYTTPTHLRAKQPDIWDRLQREYREAGIFKGTVGGSEVVVAVRP